MAFWAPFVLVHLGGQDSITAFAKQDNDLWRRHLLNLVIQAGVAGYVVAKASWPDARLRYAMVIMFVCGCFKYAERVCCLQQADTETLRQGSKYMLWRNAKGIHYYRDDDMMLLLRIKEGKDRRTLMYADREKRNLILADKDNQKLMSAEVLNMMEKGSSAMSPYEHFFQADRTISKLIAVDAPLNMTHNIAVAAHGVLHRLLEGFLSSKSRHSAYEHVGALLEYCYRNLYTKERCRLLRLSHFLPLSTAIASSIALALFRAAVVDKATGARDQHHHTTSSSSKVDVTVTYALLVGTITLDVSTFAITSFRHLRFYFPCLANCIPRWPACCRKQWSQQLHQYNIINTAGMLRIWAWFGQDLDSISDDRTTSIKEFILHTLLLLGTRKEWSTASTRGHIALHNWKMMPHRHKQDQHSEEDADDHRHLSTTEMATLKSLQDTIRSSADFPTSVLTLHIATDICFHFGGTNNSVAVKKNKQMSTELSNYIMYLVFKRGVMLTTYSKIAHDLACDEIDKALSHPPKIYQCLKLAGQLLLNRSSPVRKVDHAAVMRLIKSVEVPQQEDSLGEIKIIHQESEERHQQDPTIEIKNQESEEQQNSSIEIENREFSDVDDHNAAAADHIRKLRMNSKTLMSPVLPRAVAVAQELIGIKNEAERWELIAMVWAEMLYYTAPRCGGDFHYEHLSRGGEFVTHVLLLMYYLGPFLPPPS